ncbi:MAG TPA: hypothetical protein VGO21_05330 [Candidatus Paceibacterota bacterium]|jgi:hypothetical protein|nr:hypothetical protein [Candidatus Paceibacterota bacterium]
MKLLHSRFVSIFLIIALVLVTAGVLPLEYAHAGSLSVMSDTMSREKISTASSQVIKFTVATTMVASQTITITWPSDFTNTSAVFGDVSMTYGAAGTNTTCTIAASATSGQTCGAVWSTTGNRLLTLTMPSAAWTTPIVATNIIIITIASTHELNPTTPGSFTISLATSAGDSGSLAVPIIGAGGTTDENEVITGTVAPTLTFTNDDSTIGFGTFSSSVATYANGGATGTTSDVTAHTLAIGTNAPSGYSLTYNGPTLTGTPTGTISAVGATGVGLNGTPGTSQFGISGQLTGTGTMSAQYDHATPKFAFVAGATTALSSSAGAASDSIGMHYLVNIPTTALAGSYTTTVTYIVTGNF